MSKYGKLIDADTLEFTRLLPGPIERVWSYLVESDKRATWLASGNTELRVGGTVELNFKNSGLSELPDEAPAEKYQDMPEEVSFSGKVTDCDPPRRLSFIWPGKDEDSEVTYELEAKGEDVLLTITHARIKEREDLLGASAGWHTHLDILVDVMNNQPAQPFWTMHNKLEKDYQSRF